MRRTGLFEWLCLGAFSLLASGCGLTQSVKQGTSSLASAMFSTSVDTLRLDFYSRARLNPSATEMNDLSLPTLVRVYQLRDSAVVGNATYESVSGESAAVLNVSALDERTLVLQPGKGASLDMPLHPDAQSVAVIALVRQPDTEANTWRLLLDREALHPDRSRTIELSENRLTLMPLAEGPP